MGYTHYWCRSKPFTQKQWETICMRTLDAIVKHCDRNRITLAWEYDSPAEPQPTFFGGPMYGPKVPQVDNDVIRFNGWKDDGHETFMLTKEKPEQAGVLFEQLVQSPSWNPAAKESFDFCKTARKPYDMAVMLVLLIAHDVAPKSIRISSDGDWDSEWVPARDAYTKLFGKEPACPFAKEPA